MIVALVLDIATSTGYCLVKIKTMDTIVLHDDDREDEVVPTPVSAEIYEYGVIHVDRTSRFFADHCMSLTRQVERLVEVHGITSIAMEDYFFSQSTINNCKLSISLRTAVAMLARQKGMGYTMLNPVLWQKFIAGHTSLTKEQEATWGGKRKAKKVFIQDALWKHWGVRFPNHSLSKATGKPVTFCHDITDAVGQAIYHCAKMWDLKKEQITCTVAVPPDVKFKHFYYRY